jgi:hypothetical protein
MSNHRRQPNKPDPDLQTTYEQTPFVASNPCDVGEVRRVIAASPRYLVKGPQIIGPTDLAHHQMISMTHFGVDLWSFPPANQSAVPRVVQFTPLPKWKSSAMATSSISPQVLSINLVPHALAPRHRSIRQPLSLWLLDPQMFCRKPGFSTDFRKELHQLGNRALIQ